MKKKGQRKGGNPSKTTPGSDSDEPNPESRDYFYDDIDEFHANKDKIPLDKVTLADGTSSEEEDMVLGIDSDSDEDDAIYNKCKKHLRVMKEKSLKDAKYRNKRVEDEEPDKDWGSRKTSYYGGLGDEEILLSGSDGELDAAILEEEEALSLQKKMAQSMDDEDFGFEMFALPEKTDRKTEKIVKDLTKLPRKEKLEILKKESPELLELMKEFETKLTEVKNVLLPLQQLLVEEGRDAPSQTLAYVQTKLRLTLSYVINISFYLKLKSERLPVQNHPILKRLLQYRNLLKQIEPLDEQFHSEMEMLATCLQAGETVQFAAIEEDQAPAEKRTQRIPRLDGDEATAEEKGVESTGLDYSAKNGDDKEDDDKKRAVTYQIMKNKGLTRYNKKVKSNPRVKHKLKFRRAKIRRKGQVRVPRKEEHRYGGEISGIRSGVRHSIKLQ